MICKGPKAVRNTKLVLLFREPCELVHRNSRLDTLECKHDLGGLFVRRLRTSEHSEIVGLFSSNRARSPRHEWSQDGLTLYLAAVLRRKYRNGELRDDRRG